MARMVNTCLRLRQTPNRDSDLLIGLGKHEDASDLFVWNLEIIRLAVHSQERRKELGCQRPSQTGPNLQLISTAGRREEDLVEGADGLAGDLGNVGLGQYPLNKGFNSRLFFFESL